jgi:hypothetical protein
MDPDVRGYAMLAIYGMNAYALIAERGVTPPAGAEAKNTYDLYPKATMGDIHQAIALLFKSTDLLWVGTDDNSKDRTNKYYCFLRDSDGPFCHAVGADQDIDAIDDWHSDLPRNPFNVHKRIAPFDDNGLRVVLEMRNPSHAINAGARLTYDPTHHTIGFHDAAAIAKGLGFLQ